MSGSDREFPVLSEGAEEAEETTSELDELIESLNIERQRIAAELRDIGNKIDQSRGEVERLAQRNTAITSELRMMERDFEAVPRVNIKALYETAQEVQQRLFSMRGQLERFQAEEEILRRYQEMLEAIGEAVEHLTRGGSGGEPPPSAQALIVRVIDAQEAERERLARQMHDGPAQSLTNFILQVEICQTLLDRDPDRARTELENLKTAANAAFQRVRDFIFDLRPMMLTDLGLRPTLKRYIDAFREKTGIEAVFEFIGQERRLESYREVLIFRGIQELLANVRDHSGATQVVVTLEVDQDTVRTVVEDNGRGFGTGELKLDPDSSKALGLGTLHNRVSLVGGRMNIISESGQGAKIEMIIPAGPEPEEIVSEEEVDID